MRGLTTLKLSLGAGLACTLMAFAAPASAQVGCPVGYGYSPGYGCVPVSPGYAAVYGPPAPVYAAPPVYDPLSIAFGIGGDRHHGGHWHGGHGHDDHGHR